MQTLDHDPNQPIDAPAPSAPPPVPATPSRSLRRFLSGLPAVAALLAIVLITVTLLTTHGRQAAGPSSANATPSPVRGSDTELHDLSLVSPTEGWAVGYATPTDNPNAPTVVLMHYTHRVWSRVQTTIRGRINSVSMASATDGWAVGESGLLLHYDGTTWRKTPSPTQLNLVRVQMLSASDGWAVGDGYDSVQTGLWHYDGQRWTAQPLPAPLKVGLEQNTIKLSGLSMLSPSEGWAVGALNLHAPDPAQPPPPSGVILHDTKGQWTVHSIFTGASLQGVSMASSIDGWAAGYTETRTTTTQGDISRTLINTAGLLLHYTGEMWTRVPNPLATPDGKNDANLWGVVLGPASSGWMVGPASLDAPELLHYDGSQWTPVSAPAVAAFQDETQSYVISSIAITSTTEAWAVGAKFSTEAGGIPVGNGAYQPTITPVILHYVNGSWSIDPI